MQILVNHVSGPLAGADLGKDEPMTKTTQKKDKPRSASASENVTHPQMSITNARSPRGDPKTIVQVWMQFQLTRRDKDWAILVTSVALSPPDYGS